MDGTLTLKQYTIFIRIVSFLRPFKNIGLKLILLLVLLTLLGTVILILLHLYYRVIMYLDSAIYSIF
jgi:hypothetical protein